MLTMEKTVDIWPQNASSLYRPFDDEVVLFQLGYFDFEGADLS